MLKTSTFLAALVLVPAMATASVPNDLTVYPAENSTVNEISAISIEYLSGWAPEINWYSSPDIRINNIPMSGTMSGSETTMITYTLNTPLTAPGEYTIFIGAGSFWYDLWSEDDNPDMSWTVTIGGGSESGFQPISNPVSIAPVQGEYASLQSFVITFNSSYMDANTTKTCYLMRDDDTQQIVATGKPSEGAGLANGNVDLTREVTEPGTYILVVPEGAFYDYLTDDDEPEYRFRYVISENGQSSVTPDNIYASPADGSTVTELSEVVLEYLDYTDIYPNYTFNGSITVSNEAGVTVAEATTQIGSGGLASNEVRLNISPAVQTEGVYTLTVPAKAFVLETATMYAGQYNAPVKLTYSVNPSVGVDEISVGLKEGKVFRMDGTRVKGETLPAVYVMDGKKVVITK